MQRGPTVVSRRYRFSSCVLVPTMVRLSQSITFYTPGKRQASPPVGNSEKGLTGSNIGSGSSTP